MQKTLKNPDKETHGPKYTKTQVSHVRGGASGRSQVRHMRTIQMSIKRSPDQSSWDTARRRGRVRLGRAGNPLDCDGPSFLYGDTTGGQNGGLEIRKCIIDPGR